VLVSDSGIAVTNISFAFAFVVKESEIFMLATDATGRFVVSADKQNAVNVWDVSVAE